MKRPVVWFLLPYLGGIMLGESTDLPDVPLLALLALLLSIALIAYRRNLFPLLSTCLLAASFTAGASAGDRVFNSPPLLNTPHFTEVDGTIITPVELAADGSCVAVVRVNAAAGLPSPFRIRLKIFQYSRNLRYGDRISFSTRLKPLPKVANPGQFNFGRLLKVRGIAATAFLYHDRNLKIIDHGGGNQLLRLLDQKRSEISALFDRLDNPKRAAVLKAVTLGEKRGLSEETRELFSRAGVAHLLAISGLHIGIIGGLIFFSLKKMLVLFIPFSRRYDAGKPAALASLPVIVLYTLFCGWPLSAVRAAIMIGVFLIARALNRGAESINALGLAALIIVLIWPGAPFELSFQLSFISVLAIVILIRRFEDRSQRGKFVQTGLPDRFSRRADRYIKLSAITAVAGLLSTAPLVARSFNIFSPIALLTNIALAPIFIFFVTPLGFAGVTAGLFSEAAGFFFIRLADYTAEPIIRLFQLAGSIPLASWDVPPPNFFETTIFYLALISLLVVKPWRRAASLIGVLALVTLVEACTLEIIYRFDTKTEITFFAVGNGDSILVELPYGETMLVDAGGHSSGSFDPGESVVGHALQFKRIKHIDYLFASHPQQDHVGGMPHIIKNFSIGRFYRTPADCDLDAWQKTLSHIDNKNIETVIISRESPRIITRGAAITIIWPPREFVGTTSDLNDSSLVLLIETHDGTSIMLTSDLTDYASSLLVEHTDIGHLDILQLPHHGSESHAAKIMIEKFKPDNIVISSGWINNRKRATLNLIQNSGDKLSITDSNGAVVYKRHNGQLTH
jgi:competence protein ComEC